MLLHVDLPAAAAHNTWVLRLADDAHAEAVAHPAPWRLAQLQASASPAGDAVLIAADVPGVAAAQSAISLTVSGPVPLTCGELDVLSLTSAAMPAAPAFVAAEEGLCATVGSDVEVPRPLSACWTRMGSVAR